MKPEPRADEPRRDQVRLRQKPHVAVPSCEDVRVRPFEFPHSDLEFPGQVVQVSAHDHGREDRVLAAEHQHLALPEAQLLEGPPRSSNESRTNSWSTISIPLMM